MSDVTELPVDDVRFVKELYPRLREDDAAIERYRAALNKLPPITVARDGVLVDGFHRWQAHRREDAKTIQVENLGDLSDAEILRESYRRNSTHGQQLSKEDKRAATNQLYLSLPGAPAERYAEIAELLSLSLDSVETYARDARRYEKDQQQAKAWDMWLDCWPQQAIADLIGVPQPTINGWLSKTVKDPGFDKPPESQQHFDVWNFGPARDDTAGSTSYFGVMPPQVVENLLWLYTAPGGIVFDPFAGSGTTIDVAKRMGRRIWASDLKPSTPTLPITAHDITTGWPDTAPPKVNFTLLDPPYWRQAVGKYSDDAEDLGNQTIEQFMDSWEKVVKVATEHTTDKIAFIISPTQLDDGTVVDHAFDMYRVCDEAGLNPVRRIIVTYSTQQATGQQVTWARENRRLLKLYRDLVVFEI